MVSFDQDMVPAGINVIEKASRDRICVSGKAELDGVTYDLQLEFLPKSDDGHDGYWARVLPPRTAPLSELISSGTSIELSFNCDDSIVHFHSVLVKSRGWPWQDKTVLLREPENISITQRRKNERLYVPTDFDVRATVLPSAAADAQVVPVAAVMSDVSRSGARLFCPPEPAINSLEPGHSLRITIHYQGTQVTLDAKLRRSRKVSETTTLMGVQFAGLDPTGDEGNRLAFDRLLDDLASLQYRRHFRVALRRRMSMH